MKFLFEDPRPDLQTDTVMWTKLLRLIPDIGNTEIAEILQKRLWTMRSAGTQIRPTTNGLKFVALIGEVNDWEDESEFEEVKRRYLAPYSKEISWLLQKVSGDGH